MKTNVTIKTRLNKDDKNPKITTIIYDWTGCTVEDLIGVSTDSMNILHQAQFRRAKLVPQTREVRVKEFVATIGSRSVPVTVDGIVASAATFKPEELNALVAKVLAMQKLAAQNAKKAA